MKVVLLLVIVSAAYATPQKRFLDTSFQTSQDVYDSVEQEWNSLTTLSKSV